MSATIYGPETWKADDSGGWSYWDLWFCTLCLTDYDGDWDGLDRAIWEARHSIGREIREAKWSHLVNLRERLDLAGLTAAALIGIPDKRTATKARNKLIKSTSLQRYALTEPMRDLPSSRLTRRAMSGWWEKFPVSPDPVYRLLDARVDVTAWRYAEDGWLAGDLADDIVTLAAKRESDDPAVQVAARRAALTLLHEAQANCDDSYGRVGLTVEGALDAYARTPWRQAGLKAEVFWRDFTEITCLMSNYGTPNAELMVELFQGARVARDADLVERVLREVESDYRAARMSWHADTAGTWQACVALATGHVTKFPELGARAPWYVVQRLVASAGSQGRPDVARELLEATIERSGDERVRAQVRDALLGLGDG